MHVIEEKVKKYIKENNLIECGDTLVIGVSGGADSMMLLYFLYKYQHEYQIQLKAAHVHHGLREEADEDQEYVEEICRKWDIPCYSHRCNVKELAYKWKMTEEEAGREERYRFFITLTNGDGKIVTAHHANDQAETVLMRFFRGADIKGLGGILPRRDHIIRPVLCLTREEIENYCEEAGIQYKTDHTNFDVHYTRNKIRLQCIPYIKEAFNPRIVETLFEHSKLYQEEEEFLQDYIDERWAKLVRQSEDQLSLNLEKLRQEKIYIQKKLLYKTLATLASSSKNISLKHINSLVELLDLETGKRLNMPYNITVSRSYDEVIFSKIHKPQITNYEFPVQMGINNIGTLGLEVELSLVPRKTFELSHENRYTKYIDYDKIEGSLKIRNRQSEDYIVLKTGTKKLKKFFVDEKIPQATRSSLPLIAIEHEIIWILGSRLNVQYFVTEETQNILQIKVITRETQEGLC